MERRAIDTGNQFSPNPDCPGYGQGDALFDWVIALLSRGCPKEVIVATFSLGPRTVDCFCTYHDALQQPLYYGQSVAVGCVAPRRWRPASLVTVGVSWNCCAIVFLLLSF